MKRRAIGLRIFAVMASILSALCVAAAIALVCMGHGKMPKLVRVSEEAACLADRLMAAVCSGDFQEAQSMLYGSPKLASDRLPKESVEGMLWLGYVNSLDYVLVGDLYPSEEGLVQDVKFISLELSALTENLDARAHVLLEETMDTAESVTELYDADNNFRQELVDEIMVEAARQALEEDVRYMYQIFPLQMIYRDGQWWGVADQAFLDAVSGGIAG